jgi:glycosyltransferase involved in cell wall biosynthesis
MTTTAGVIAAFNQQDYILEAVTSLVGHVDEVVVVDDASTDATGDVLDEMSFDNLLVLHNESSQGVSRSFNRAITQTSSHLILIQGGDDRSLRDRSDLQKAAITDPAVAMVYSDPRIINTAGRSMPHWLAPEFNHPEPADPLSALALGNNFICAPSVAFRRTDFLETGGFHAGLDLLQDHDLWLRLAERGDLRKLDVPVVEYRKHGRNVSREYVGLDSPRQRRMRVEQEFVFNHFLRTAKAPSRLRIARAIGLDTVAFAAMSPEDQVTVIQLSHPDRIVVRSGLSHLVELAGGVDPEAALARLGLNLRDLDRFSSLADHDNLGELRRALSRTGNADRR